MRSLAFVVLLVLMSDAAAAKTDCGEPGSRWLADFHVSGAGEAPEVVIPIDSRFNLEVREEIGFTIKVRDLKTGKNLFGTPPHGAEPYYLTPWEVRLRRSGRRFDVEEPVANVEHAGTDDGLLIIDARDLYSSEENPETKRQDEVFVQGALHLCWK